MRRRSENKLSKFMTFASFPISIALIFDGIRRAGTTRGIGAYFAAAYFFGFGVFSLVIDMKSKSTPAAEYDDAELKIFHVRFMGETQVVRIPRDQISKIVVGDKGEVSVHYLDRVESFYGDAADIEQLAARV